MPADKIEFAGDKHRAIQRIAKERSPLGEFAAIEMTGKVYLVGAGPGDPELLTLKALRVLRRADVVLHDGLVSPEILSLVCPPTRTENVGKRCGYKKIGQEEIHRRMIAYAAEGLIVVRLKGGDPLVFSRAGEEIEALRHARVRFEIVPGITAAMGAAASARVPLTDRRLASRIVFLSNHRCGEEAARDWRDVASNGATVAVYMPGVDYDGLAATLWAAGLGGETPCLIVSCGTAKEQRIHLATLSTLPKAPRFSAPMLLIIGAVAASYSPEEGQTEAEEDYRRSPLPGESSVGIHGPWIVAD